MAFNPITQCKYCTARISHSFEQHVREIQPRDLYAQVAVSAAKRAARWYK